MGKGWTTPDGQCSATSPGPPRRTSPLSIGGDVRLPTLCPPCLVCLRTGPVDKEWTTRPEHRPFQTRRPRRRRAAVRRMRRTARRNQRRRTSSLRKLALMKVAPRMAQIPNPSNGWTRRGDPCGRPHDPCGRPSQCHAPAVDGRHGRGQAPPLRPRASALFLACPRPSATRRTAIAKRRGRLWGATGGACGAGMSHLASR